MATATADRVSSPTDNAGKIVDELYDFRDHFVETYGLEQAGKKEEEVGKKMEKCLKQVDDLQGEIKNKALYQMMRGRVLNVTSKYSQEAEEALSKAVKLDPRLVDAWNHLGECYWKKEDISAAKNCFTGALNHSKNKVSLRNLSMVLRQLSGPPVEKVKLITESVERAKEAVQLDITDGTSWLILGNAYLCQFFSAGQKLAVLKQCMQAYGQAEKDPVARGNPDLHFNRATAYKYQEDYKNALEGFAKAAQLDPSWTEPKTRETELLAYLSTVSDMIKTKGKMKPKKVESLVKGLSDRDLGSYSCGQYVDSSGKTIDGTRVPFSDLKPGANEGKIVIGKVVCSVHSNDPVPFTFCMVDEAQICRSVTVYNLAQGAGMKIGDSVAIPGPFLSKVHIQHRESEISFLNIQVVSPRLLIVNGKKLGAEKEALPFLTVSAVSE